MSENVGASTSHNPKGLHGLYRENFTFTFILYNSYYYYIYLDIPWIHTWYKENNQWI
jgi:hypothetical protein